MNGCLHTRSNVARLYLPRKEGGRGLIGIEESVRKERKSLYGYLRESTEWMLQAALKEKVVVEGEGGCWRRKLSGLWEEDKRRES